MVAGSEASDELNVYKRLNTSEARLDPRNHTVPVLDWLTHKDFTFVVMPRCGSPIFSVEIVLTTAVVFRWDIIALARSEILFRNVSELLDVAETLFEVRI